MSTTNDFPSCIDCEHCHTLATPIACTASYVCIHPDVVGKDIVTGVLHPGECSDQRKDDDNQCGMTGRLWTPRIPWWAKLAHSVGLSNARF